MTSLRAKKKRATAQGLAEAAYALTVTHGLDAVTTDDIAAKTGVSRRTFANYYANKNAAVVDGFIHSIGVPAWWSEDPADPSQLPETFDDLIAAARELVVGIFTTNDRILEIQRFAKLVKQNQTLEPYVHAVLLELRNSPSHRLLAERFGEPRVSMFLGAVVGSLAGVIKLILGPLAIPRRTPPLRGIDPATADETAPLITQDAIERVLAYIDDAFTYLRDGFADPS